MPILELQKRMREVGRIRMGDKQGNRPNKLDHFRLTSSDRTALEAAAKVFGGDVRPWNGQPGQFELYVTAEEINILIAPVPVTQWYELWSAGGCQRRCDGCTETIGDQDCLCDPEERECKMTTRMSVMLPELPSLGVWRLESHGYYAAAELPMAAEILIQSAEKGQYIPATLAIEHRKRVAKGQTKNFIVPVIRLRQRLSDFLPIVGQSRPALTSGAPALPSRPGSNGAPELPERTVDPETGEVTNPPDDERRRKELETTAMQQLREKGWTANAHKSHLTQFKNTCARGSLWWPDIFVQGTDEGCLDWDDYIAFASAKADEARAAKDAAHQAEVAKVESPFDAIDKPQDALISDAEFTEGP